MVDREARDRAAMLLRRLIAGQITNDEFEGAQPETSDKAVRSFFDMAWLFYSDMREHKLDGKDRLTPGEKREVIRWILFLDSPHEYVWPDISLPGSDPRRRARTAGTLMRWLLGGDSVSKAAADTFLAVGDYDAWPFASRAEYKQALRSPRRLGGRTADAARLKRNSRNSPLN